MRNLLIQQRSPQGLLKTWRLRSEQEKATFGSSKHADLRSGDMTVHGIHGMFEFREDKWVYISLDLNSTNVHLPAEFEINKETELKLGQTQLYILPLENKKTIFSDLENTEIYKNEKDRKPFQLFTVYHGDHLLETHIFPMNKTFVSSFDETKTPIAIVPSDQWTRNVLGHVEISQRTVYLSAVDAMKYISTDQLLDSGSKRNLAVTLTAAILLSLLFLLSPNSRDAAEVAINALPPTEIKEARYVTPKKKRVAVQVKTMEQPAPGAAAKANNAADASSAVSAIKGLGQSRISQLIGKISNSAQKSANVVVTSGVVAGTVPSGAALAAVGNVAKSGKDWSQEGSSTGVRVGTQGMAGGHSVAGVGKLAGGKAGTGGAELLEDEGEIVGGLDRDIIAGIIKSNLGQILYCYERQLSASPDLYGKVAVKFTIAGDGGVETQRIGDSTLRNATVEGCILSHVAKWKFPAPQGGTKVMVTYPFLFKSTN